MSLFGGLYVGTSGLKVSQNALNTVAHNLSNINTDGYVRQQVAMTDTFYNTSRPSSQAIGVPQIGTGVVYSECRRVRDTFLDERFREESGRANFYDVSYSATLQIEDVLGELDGAAFKDSLSNVWTSIQELSKSPSDSTYISLLVSSAASFVKNARAVYTQLQEYQDNLNTQIVKTVNEINEIGEKIVELNKEIAVIEAGHLEHANDLRDQRDSLIDKLAEYGNITYEEDSRGVVKVRFNDTDFVNETNYYEMGLNYDKTTGYSTPYWTQNVIYRTDDEGNEVADYSSADVFRMSDKISTESDTDVGKLRALLLARGDHSADYTDLETSTMTRQKLKSLKIAESQYNEEMGLKYFDDYINNSSMMKVEAELDNLVHYVVTTINEVLAANADTKSGYLCNEDGSPMQLFLKNDSDAYTLKTANSGAEAEALAAGSNKIFAVYDENGNATGQYWEYVEEDPEYKRSLYNCSTLVINQELVQTPTKLGFVEKDSSTDYGIGQEFIKAFENKKIYVNPNATAATSIDSTYTEIVNQFATEGSVYKSMYEFGQLASEQADANRQTVIGTSSDEELEHVIMYQNAYNAASRYINVINTLLDSVIALGA